MMTRASAEAGVCVTRAPRSRRGRGWAARLGSVVLACAFAGTGEAQENYDGLNHAVSDIASDIAEKLVERLGEHGKLGKEADVKVLIGPSHFTEEETGNILPLSKRLYLMFRGELLRREGVQPVSGTEDDERAVTLLGKWNVESGSGHRPEYLRLSVEVVQLIGDNEIPLYAAGKGLVPLERIDKKYFEPDLESYGRYAVRQLEKDLPVWSSKYRLHIPPLKVVNLRSASERFSEYLLVFWRPAFIESRRFSIVRPPSPSEGKLVGIAFGDGEHITVSLEIVDAEETTVGAVVIPRMDKGLFGGIFDGNPVPGVTARLEECAGQVEAGRLSEARGCYEGLGADAPGDSRVRKEVEAGLERIQAVSKALVGADKALNRGGGAEGEGLRGGVAGVGRRPSSAWGAGDED